MVDDVWQSIVAQMNIVDCGHPYRANCHSQSWDAYFIPEKDAVMKIDAVQKIKDCVTIRDALIRYGYNAKKRMPCPIHSGSDNNFEIKEKTYCCYSRCGSGDVISLVQKLFDVTFQEALRKIDADFGLNIYGDHTFEELRRSHYQQQAMKAKQEREKREKQKLEDEYWAAYDELKRLDDNRRKYKPKTQCEELHPLFVESLQQLEHQKRKLYELEDRRKYYD